MEVIDRIARRPLTPVPQSETGACYAPKLSKEEAWLDWNQPAEQLERQVLAFNPWPVACARWSNQTIRIWRARASAGPGSSPPGRVLREARDGIAVACGDGVLLLTEIQLPGKRPLSAEAFLNAHSLSGSDLA
jgi:methionyl-tRNA formyltransferase